MTGAQPRKGEHIMYRTVYDLDEAEISELKEAYFYQLEESDDDNEFMLPEEIPDSVIFEHYSGFFFTEDDFFCNA